jgi:antitoxin YobK
MGMDEYERAAKLIRENAEDSLLSGPKPEELVAKAEAKLGVTFPLTYRRFLLEFGGGPFAGSAFFGVFDDDFDTQGAYDVVSRTLDVRREAGFPDNVVAVYDYEDGDLGCLELAGDGDEAPVIALTPGFPVDVNERDEVAPDFGTFLLKEVKSAIESRQIRSSGGRPGSRCG